MSLATRDVRTLVECVGRHYAPSAGPFPKHALAVLCDLIAADTRGWHRIASRGGRLAYFDYVDDPPGVFGLQSLLAETAAATFHEHPLVALNVRTRGRAAATAISDVIGTRDFRRLGVYREFFRPFGIEDQLAVAVPGSFGSGGHQLSSLDALLQGQGSTAARPRRAASPAGGAQLRRARSGARTLGRSRGRAGRPPHRCPRAGRRWQSRDGERARHRTGGSALRRAAAASRPARGAARLGDAARALPSGGASLPAPLDPLVQDGPACRITVRLLPRAADGSDVLVLEERPRELTSAALAPLALSRREAEVLVWVARGRTNAEIAWILDISLLTVKKHLEHVFTKLGVENRHAAALRALEAAGFLADR